MINNITYNDLDELIRQIGECFKSESMIDPADQELVEATRSIKSFFSLESDFNLTDVFIRKYSEPELWLFSKEHSAFDEPPTVLLTAQLFFTNYNTMRIVYPASRSTYA